MLPVTHVFSSGVAGADPVRVGDAVAVFAQGPVGLCATLGASLRGAALIIAVDAVPQRLELARRVGATIAINFHEQDPLAVIRRLTDGRGVDVAIEAVGHQDSFEMALRAVRPGGTLSSLGVYAGKLVANRRIDLSPLVTHQFALDDIRDALELMARHRESVLKVALHPAVRRGDRLLEHARVPVMLDEEAQEERQATRSRRPN